MNPKIPCNLCRIPRYKLDVLERLAQILRRVTPDNDRHRHHLIWDITVHCKYGIGSCPEIRRMHSECDEIIRKIEPKLISVAKSADERLFRDIQSQIRGNFSSVFHEMEIMHSQFVHMTQKGV